MLDFAVKVKGVHEESDNTAAWVLATDPVGERLLIAYEDKSMHWHPLGDCTFAKLVSPDAPKPTYIVQPRNAAPTLLTPNRAERRRVESNGA